eukprot:3728925-Prymnesium_polylepis.1
MRRAGEFPLLEYTMVDVDERLSSGISGSYTNNLTVLRTGQTVLDVLGRGCVRFTLDPSGPEGCGWTHALPSGPERSLYVY